MSLDDLARLPLVADQVFITENLMTYLSFPKVHGSIAIFGEGKAGERLGRLEWLRLRPLWYWGDIDSHGLEILRQLRRQFSHLRSLLMGIETLRAFEHLVSLGKPTASLELKGLTESEAESARRVLVQGELLEQEKIPQQAVFAALRDAGLSCAF